MSVSEAGRYSPFPPLQSPTRNRNSPARQRPKSRYEYVKAHRYSTQAPFLAILPIQYSLTEGTAIPAPTQLETPPQTPTKEDICIPTRLEVVSPVYSTFAGPLSSHPVTPNDTSVEESFAQLFARPESVYSNVATFGRPSATYEDFRDLGMITPPQSAPPSGSFHAHRPSVISRLFSRRNTRSSTASSSPSLSAESPTFRRNNQSTSTFYCDGGSPSFQPRTMRRTTSTYSFQTSLKRNTTIYGGEVMAPTPGDEDLQKSATFPRMMRKKSIDVLRRKSAGWFRDFEAEEEEEAARMRAEVAQREKERELEMRLERERLKRRDEFEELDDEGEEDVELPPMLPMLTMLSEASDEDDLDDIFGDIGR